MATFTCNVLENLKTTHMENCSIHTKQNLFQCPPRAIKSLGCVLVLSVLYQRRLIGTPQGCGAPPQRQQTGPTTEQP